MIKGNDEMKVELKEELDVETIEVYPRERRAKEKEMM
jgi:hypothetical protein